MAKQAVKLVFDRRKRVEATGKGNVEFIIQLSRLAVKKIIVDSMTPEEWESYKNAPFIKKEMENYQKIVNAMQLLGEEMTVENFNKHIEVDTPVRNTSKKKSKESVAETKDERINESIEVNYLLGTHCTGTLCCGLLYAYGICVVVFCTCSDIVCV